MGTISMVYCNNCGAENPEGSSFCNSCGAKIGSSVVKKPMDEGVTVRSETKDTYVVTSVVSKKKIESYGQYSRILAGISAIVLLYMCFMYDVGYDQTLFGLLNDGIGGFNGSVDNSLMLLLFYAMLAFSFIGCWNPYFCSGAIICVLLMTVSYYELYGFGFLALIAVCVIDALAILFFHIYKNPSMAIS